MKQFELNIALGTFLTTDGVSGSNTGFSYARMDKGNSLRGTGGNNIIFSKTLTGVRTILFGIKKDTDSKIFLDDTTDKLEISSGDITATGLSNCYIDNVDTNTVGNGYRLVIAEFSSGIDFSTNIKIAPSSLIYLASKIVFYDELLNSSQRAAELNSFIHSTPMLTEKYPKHGSWTKPTSLNEVGLVAAYNFIPSNGTLVDISGSGNNGVINGCVSDTSGLVFDGVNSYVDIGSNINIGNIHSIAFRLKGKDLSAISMILRNRTLNDDQFRIENTQITYRVSDVSTSLVFTFIDDMWYDIVVVRNGVILMLYVNGILITTGVAGSTDDFEFGTIGADASGAVPANVLDGILVDLKIYDYAFTPNQAANYHNQFANRVVLADDLSYDPVGSNLPIGWRKSGGTFSVAEDNTGKYILCGSNGNIVYPGIDLSSNVNNGFIKKLSGDLNSDEGKLISEATNISYANNKVTVAMTAGQKFRDIYITKGYKLRAVTPDNISVEPKFWLDGQDSSQFTLDGNYINNWVCKGSLSADVFNTNNDATRPTYDINTGRVTFIAANSTFLKSAIFGTELSQPNTVFIVYKSSSVSYIFDGGAYLFVIGALGGNWGMHAGLWITGNSVDANNNIHCCEFNGATSNYWLNGGLIASGDVANNNLNGITLAAKYNTTSNFSDVEICEVIGFNSRLPFAENYGIVLYLKDKWSI